MAESNFDLNLKPDTELPTVCTDPVSLTESGYGTFSGSYDPISLELPTPESTVETRPESDDSLPERFQCKICNQVLVHPTQAECGHMFCRVCIEAYFDTNPATTVCPNPDDEDCHHISKNGLRLDNGTQKEIQELSVYCPSKNPQAKNYEGILIWKIEDFNNKKQNAIDGNEQYIDSEPFYTGRYGYKMCARVYLNGDGNAKGSHLSIYFVVMMGEYDALLPWPFKQKVKLMLLDQKSDTRHLSENFIPDSTSNSFQKPVAEMNKGYGPWHVVAKLIEKEPFLVQDVLFVKVVVDKFKHGDE